MTIDPEKFNVLENRVIVLEGTVRWMRWVFVTAGTVVVGKIVHVIWMAAT